MTAVLSDAAESHYARALAMLEARRWNEAMTAFEQAFARDSEGLLDRRRCVEWFCTLTLEEVPDFWLAELTRFFRRYDIEKSRYAMAGLQALGARPEFRALLQGKASETELDAVMRSELFGLLLRDTVLGKSTFELAMVRLRRVLLLEPALRARAPLDFLCDFALQCFNNEYVYFESPEETARIEPLAGEVAARLAQPDTGGDELMRRVAVLGLYRPLSAVPGLEAVISPSSAAMDRLLSRTVVTAMVERRLRERVPAIGRIFDATSLRVQAQYEEHPYPRWFTLERVPWISAAEWIASEVPGGASVPAEPRMLVAGCGTGIETLALARRVSGLQITAVDLSRASLAYAQRKADRIGAPNVRFLQADILDLDALGETFDVVYSTGVLHHLRDPQAGLRQLVRRLRPGGLLKLGLYSTRGRAAIREARGFIEAEGIAPDAAGIRGFRQRVLQSAPDSPLRRLLRWRDFFSLSECRDLLFHAEEHDFRLPQIAAMLRDEGLEALGLSLRLPPGAAGAYRALYPGDERATDLARWDSVEEKHPQLFAGMFHLWSRRPQTGG